jgi:hypothetical protein
LTGNDWTERNNMLESNVLPENATKEEILAALSTQGISSLDELVDRAVDFSKSDQLHENFRFVVPFFVLNGKGPHV